MPRYTILFPLITSIWTWHEDGSRCDIREPFFVPGYRKPPEMSVNPSIHSGGFLFGNSPVSVGYRLVVTKVGKAFGNPSVLPIFVHPPFG